MTFDLFDDEPVAAPAPHAPDPERLAYFLVPAGLNRWEYKGEILMYDTHKVAVAGRGRWSSIEGISKPEIRGESHVDVCKAIDARQENHHA
jgi:hypothetical protein